MHIAKPRALCTAHVFCPPYISASQTALLLFKNKLTLSLSICPNAKVIYANTFLLIKTVEFATLEI